MEFYLAAIFGSGNDQSEILGLFDNPNEALDQIKKFYNGEKIWVEDYMEKYGTINVCYFSPNALTAQVIKMTVGKKVNFNL